MSAYTDAAIAAADAAERAATEQRAITESQNMTRQALEEQRARHQMRVHMAGALRNGLREIEKDAGDTPTEVVGFEVIRTIQNERTMKKSLHFVVRVNGILLSIDSGFGAVPPADMSERKRKKWKPEPSDWEFNFQNAGRTFLTVFNAAGELWSLPFSDFAGLGKLLKRAKNNGSVVNADTLLAHPACGSDVVTELGETMPTLAELLPHAKLATIADARNVELNIAAS